MAKIDLQLKKFSRKIEDSLKRRTSREEMRRLGLLAIELIVERTQGRGKGVPPKRGSTGPYPNERPLKALSSSYKKYRRANRDKLASETSPNKSNLTFTGRMLRSMRIKSISQRSGELVIGPNRRARKGGLTNEDVAEFVSSARPFLNLSRREVATINKFIERGLKSDLRKI